MIFESNSPDETKEIAKRISSQIKPPAVYCLTGGLGAGKTVFAKGFAEGLGVTEEVTSPTFSIINEYAGANGLELYHFDVYRITDLDGMGETGCEEYFYGGGVCLIEWAELIKPLIPDGAVWINIEIEPRSAQTTRFIEIRE